MRRSLADVHRKTAAAYRRHLSTPPYQTVRNTPVTPRRFKPRGLVIAVIAILGFATWFLILSSL
jgi:hypothetical protein